jgi:hypothetical protein
MKKTILLLAVALFFSCSQETTSQEDLFQENVDFSQLKVTLENPISNTLFQYKNKKELQERLSVVSESILQESKELLQEHKEVQRIVSQFSFKDGKATLVGYRYVDKDGKVIKSFSTTQRQSDPVEDFLNGACPDGYIRVGRCSNVGDTQKCIGKHLSAYLSDALNSVGDCANVQISVGLLNTTVCGQTC